MQGVLRGVQGKWLALLLEDGQIGLWTVAGKASEEDPWKKAIPQLRKTPADVGPCRFLESVSPADLEPDATEKFRNYHHFGGVNLPWEVVTAGDKARIRELLFSPPTGEYVAVIGDGQKHGVINANPGYGPDMAAVYYLPSLQTIDYRPSRLAALVDAVELRVAAGCDDEELISGKYIKSSVSIMLAIKQTAAIFSDYHGSPIFELALFLRRARPQLKEDQTLGERIRPPAAPVRPDGICVEPTVEPARNIVRPAPSPDPAPTVGVDLHARGDRKPEDVSDRVSWPIEPPKLGQLSLFGR